MNLKVQRRMASELLKCGRHRVWIDPENAEVVSRAITREDIRRLIKKGLISKKQEKGTSRGRAREAAEQRRKGRRKGPGRRKGTKHARMSKKERWMRKIRSQRKYLRELRDSGEIDRHLYRRLYNLAKGGVFRSKSHIDNYMAHMKERGER